MIEFEAKVYDDQGEWRNTYDLGRASLDMEIDNLPKGWTLHVRRIDGPKDAPAKGVQPEDYITARSQ